MRYSIWFIPCGMESLETHLLRLILFKIYIEVQCKLSIETYVSFSKS